MNAEVTFAMFISDLLFNLQSPADLENDRSTPGLRDAETKIKSGSGRANGTGSVRKQGGRDGLLH
jgi:hypothetical protein